MHHTKSHQFPGSALFPKTPLFPFSQRFARSAAYVLFPEFPGQEWKAELLALTPAPSLGMADGCHLCY